MNLTKYGISAALIAAIGYFAGYISLIAVVLLFIFVLYTDMQVDLKKNLTQAVVLAVFFEILGLVLSACDYAGRLFINDLYNVFSDGIYQLAILFGWLEIIVHLLEFGLMIYAIIAALSGKVVKLPIITKMVAKHFGEADVPIPQNTENTQ